MQSCTCVCVCTCACVCICVHLCAHVTHPCTMFWMLHWSVCAHVPICTHEHNVLLHVVCVMLLHVSQIVSWHFFAICQLFVYMRSVMYCSLLYDILLFQWTTLWCSSAVWQKMSSPWTITTPCVPCRPLALLFPALTANWPASRTPPGKSPSLCSSLPILILSCMCLPNSRTLLSVPRNGSWYFMLYSVSWFSVSHCELSSWPTL